MTLTDAQRAPEDLSQVRLEEQWEVSYWCVKFGVTPDRLAATVREVGPRAEDVEAQLHKAARTSFRMGGED